MNKTASSPTIACGVGRESSAARILSGITRRVTAKARWIISASAAVAAPLVLIAEGEMEPITHAVVCFGNGSFMALAARTNALTLIP